MKELKFELSIPAAQIERLIQSALIVAFGLTTPGITVKMQEEFIPSCGSEGKSGPKPIDDAEEYVWEEKGKPKDVADVLKEAMSEVNKMNTELRKEHWTKKLENSLLTKLIAFKCDCGHITWRLCKDGDFKCECNKCNKVYEWDITELYRLEYSCKCGYRKYLYMPLSHRIEEMKCGGCKAPIDIVLNDKKKRFEQVK